MNKIEYTLMELLNILVIAQKAIHNEEGKEVALIISSSRTKKNKGNKSKKAKGRVPKSSGGVNKTKSKKKIEKKDKKKFLLPRRGTLEKKLS